MALPEGGDGATVLALAICPASPDLLAITHADAAAVQLWRLPQRQSRDEATVIATLELSAAPRQLTWHPHRRLLCVALPDLAVLFEVGGRTATTPARHDLELPAEGGRGALHACCWGVSGGMLAAACEGEVVLYRWALLGLDWGGYTRVRFPLHGRALCSLVPLLRHNDSPDNDDDDDDDEANGTGGGGVHHGDDAFVLGLGVPIMAGEEADITDGASRRLPAGGEGNSATGGADGGSCSSSSIIDLVGRIGGGGGMSTRAGLLDLSAELEALRPPALVQQSLGKPVGQGELRVAAGQPDGTARQLGGGVNLDAARPDVLASAAGVGAPAGGTAGSSSASLPLVAAASSSGGRLFLFTCSDAATSSPTLNPLCVLDLPEGYRCRGLSFGGNAGGTKPPLLYALGGRRQQVSVVFSSPRARQQLLLCAYNEDSRGGAILAAAAKRTTTHTDAQRSEHAAAVVPGISFHTGLPSRKAVTAVPQTTAVDPASGAATSARPSRCDSEVLPYARAGDTANGGAGTAAGELGVIFGGLQGFLDGKFAALEGSLAKLDARLTRVESGLQAVQAATQR